MPNENVNINDNDVVVVDTLDTEGLKNSLQSALGQKKHWREKAVDPSTGKTYKELFEAASKPKEPELPKETPTETPKPAAPDMESIWDNLEVIKGLESDEMTEMRTEAKSLGVDPVKYIKSKAGQAHLKELRSTKKSQEGTPAPSNRVPQFNGKPVDDVLKDEKSSASDKQKAFEAKVRGPRGNNQSA